LKETTQISKVVLRTKGYTTIISPETLITEPGLAGIYNFTYRGRYNEQYFDDNGVSPSLDVTNGDQTISTLLFLIQLLKATFSKNNNSLYQDL
jgi:hypothetical protein